VDAPWGEAGAADGRPRVVVVGLGPAGPELLPAAGAEALTRATRCLLRTARHPAAAAVFDLAPGRVDALDRLYEEGPDFDAVYRAIVDEVVAAALLAVAEAAVEGPAAGAPPAPFVAYAVPGSPLVAERTVRMLRADGRVALTVVPAPSFLDLAWARLGVDPVEAGVRLVDGTAFAVEAAGERGPLLVAQCHSRSVLSDIKLAADDVAGSAPRAAVLLHHLGLPDEQVLEVAWTDLDRRLEPDHLTALWVPELAPPVAGELVRLEELVRTLRARCPWDRRQTHGSLARHLMEEAYEALDAIDALSAAEPDVPAEAVAHLEEELGDLMFQVFFHALLATEEGRFTLADVAHTLHAKLVGRHPHVFGDAVADTPEEVAARWEVLKKAEKGRARVTEGIPAALPALALAAKLQRKAESLGLDTGTLEDRRREIAAGLAALVPPPGAGGAPPESSGETLEAGPAADAALGALLFALADAARRLGVDPEGALRAQAQRFRQRLDSAEDASA